MAEEGIQKLTKDLLKAAEMLSDTEARFLVDYYYIVQEDRKRSANQGRALEADEEPNTLLWWFLEQNQILEKQIQRALDKYTQHHEMGSWMRSVYGIGPVLSAGLLAHIDIEKAPTVGHIWRFAGLDPTVKWGKGQKRPWNGQLKTLCWKIGQSFMKFYNKEECVYGKLYQERKKYEIDRNEAGGNREAAELGKARVSKSTEAYKHYSEGRLPPAQVDARARRYAVKQFLSDLHGEWYWRHYGKKPPLPYPIAILGHAHLRNEQLWEDR